MLNCKNCGEKLTKFNKEICPYCGCKNPLSESVAETDTTKAVSFVNEEDVKVKNKSFKTFILLTYFLGIFGIEYIYLNKKKDFCFALGGNLLIYICLFFIIYACSKEIWILILLPILFLYILNILYALFLTFNKAKINDKNGVSLK